MVKFKFERVLVLAPHTDDGELGAGGFISKLIEQGSEVHYVAFSNSEESVPVGFPTNILEVEMVAATAMLGIQKNNTIMKYYPVRKFNYHRQDILEDMVKLRLSYSPDLILAPSLLDIHQDHSIIAQECLRAFKHSTIMGYELVWNTMQFPSQLCVELESRHIQAKCDSLKEYKSQSQRKYMDETFIKALARVRGMAFNLEFGEVFELVRMKL